ncbi:MAG: hypothetical protein IT556_11540 [Acetobacteraceae bacterium]|nr:hypothetical protein [Acetobacteraceae bacterium]
MILAVLPRRPGEAAPMRLPAALLPLLGQAPCAVVMLGRGDLAPGGDARPLAPMIARSGMRPEAFADALLTLPHDRVPVLLLTGLKPGDAVAVLGAVGSALAQRDRLPPALLVAGQDEDVATLAEALADACLVRAVGLALADRRRVAGRIRRRAALLRWFGPNLLIRSANAVLRRVRTRLKP